MILSRPASGSAGYRPRQDRTRPVHGSVGQTSAALGTAAGQHLAAIAGGHTLAETVFLGTLALLGLIGTKLGDTSSFDLKPADRPNNSRLRLRFTWSFGSSPAIP